MVESLTFAADFKHGIHADMAQLVEQRIRNAWVRGSSPRVGSKKQMNKSQIPVSAMQSLSAFFLLLLLYDKET